MNPLERDALAVGSARVLSEILEAVRALKPAPEVPSLRDPDFYAKMAAAQIGQRGLAEPEDSPRMQGYRECADLKKFEIEGLLVENATLKAELAQTKHLLSEERALTAATVASQSLRETVNSIWVERADHVAELKRFREREEKLWLLYEVVEEHESEMRNQGLPVSADEVARRLAAVRDFRVTP